MKSAKAFAPGKIILCGEHFVVHGGVAIAAALDKGVEVEARLSDETSIEVPQLSLVARPPGRVPKQLAPLAAALEAFREHLGNKADFKATVRTNIPIGAGLGSSSAAAVAFLAAVTRALGEEIEGSRLTELAMVSERIVHGNPSGIDVRVAIEGGVIAYSRTAGSKNIQLTSPLSLAVAYSGKTRSTADLINLVAEFKNSRPELFAALVKASSQLAEDAEIAVREADLEVLGSVMHFHHAALSLMGLSTLELDLMVNSALEQGAYAAKITGAGGGGCIIALLGEGDQRKILKALRKVSSEVFVTKIPNPGVEVWT